MGFIFRPENPSGTIGCPDSTKGGGSCGIPQAEIYFRPTNTYKGEFGFDWLRNGDVDFNGMLFPGHNQSINDYKNIIAGGFGIAAGVTTTEKQEAYRKLETEYSFIPINGKTEHYHYHWLSLFSEKAATKINSDIQHPAGTEVKSEATLNVVIKLNDLTNKPERILFLIKDPKRLTVTSSNPADPYLPNTLICSSVNSTDKEILGTITIKCLKDLSKNTAIEAYAMKGDDPPLLAGVLMVNKNDFSVRKKQDVVVVYMLTRIDGGTPKNGSDIVKPHHFPSLYYFLHQNLLYGSIETTRLDVMADIRFRLPSSLSGIEATHPDAGKYVSSYTIGSGASMISGFGLDAAEQAQIYLTQKLPSEHRNKVRNFVFNEELSEAPVAGFSWNGSKVVFIMKEGKDSHQVCAHETGHSLGLGHSFINARDGIEKSKKYYFESDDRTDNFLSYNQQNTTRKSTWYWQWQIVNKEIK